MQNRNGNLVTNGRTTYYPFSDYRGTPPSQTLTDRGFTGQKSNNQPAADLGLLYYNARYYLPTIGKFASADTIVPDPAGPQQFNRYAYTLNSPLNFTDSSGHSVDCTIGITCTVNSTNPLSWQLAKTNYEIGEDLIFAPSSASQPSLYGQFALGPLSVTWDQTTGDIADVSIGDGIGIYLGFGGGANLSWNFGTPHLDKTSGYEYGLGLGAEIYGIGFEAKRFDAFAEGTITLGYGGTLGLISYGEGIVFDKDSIVLRPDSFLASELGNGNDEAWQYVWNTAYGVPLPPGTQGPIQALVPQNYALHTIIPYFENYGGYVPIHQSHAPQYWPDQYQ